MKSIWLIFALVTAAGCSGDARCAIDADCFAGERCVESRCTVAQSSGGDVSNIDDRDMSSTSQDMRTNSSSGDMSPTVDDGTVPIDMSSPTEDMASPLDTGTSSACVVDPFTYVCTDDGFEDNNVWVDGENLLPQIVGCNPDFIAHDETYLATLCPLDGSDWYYFNFRACDVGYVIEWQLILDSACDADLVAFEPLSFKCDEEFVDCTTVEGKPTIRMLVTQQNFQNLQSTYVQVHNKDRDDVTFDYRIRVSVRQ